MNGEAIQNSVQEAGLLRCARNDEARAVIARRKTTEQFRIQRSTLLAKNPRGTRVTVRLTPKAGRDALEGVAQLADGRSVLQARVRAAPHEGEANAALIKLLAKALGVPAREVQLVGRRNYTPQASSHNGPG